MSEKRSENTKPESALATLEGMPESQYVIMPGDLPVPMQMKAAAMLTTFMEMAGIDEGDLGGTMEVELLGPIMDVTADVLQWVYDHATTGPEAAAKLDEAFKGRFNDALEFSLTYAAAVGEFMGSAAK